MKIGLLFISLIYCSLLAAQAPSISSFTPTSGGFLRSIRINGSNFTGATSVKFGGVPASGFSVFSPTLIFAQPASGATGDVSVTTPVGSANMPGFTFTSATITSFLPDSGYYNSTVLIKGYYFLETASAGPITNVQFGGVDALSFTILSDTSILATVGNAFSGDVMLVMTDPNFKPLKPGFRYLGPVINSFTPTEGGPGTTVNIFGTGFNGTSSVSFGGMPATSYTVDSATGITAVTGPGSAGNVVVVTPLGTATKEGFISPSISSFTPTTGAPGTIITIRGDNFTGATNVSFGTTAVASFSVLSDSVITTTLSKVSTGTVVVTTAAGTGTKPGFTYNGPPTITSISKLNANANDTILITGTGFNTRSNTLNVVYFGTDKAMSSMVLAVTSTTLKVKVPAAGGGGTISVTCNNYTSSFPQPFFVTYPLSGVPLSENAFAKHYIGVSGQSYSIAAGDFTNDRLPDILSIETDETNQNLFKLRILKNTGSLNAPAFTLLSSISVIGNKDIAVGDINGVGSLDVVVAGGGNSVQILYGFSSLSNYSLTNTGTFITGAGANAVAIADIDNDGKADIVSANSIANNLSVLRSSCGNPCITPFTKTDIAAGGSPNDIATADIDQDGLPDIIVTNGADANVSVFRNISVGSAIAFAPKVNLPMANPQYSLVISDLNKDGKPDIATLDSTGMLSILKNVSSPGSVTFLPRQSFSPSTTIASNTYKNLAAGDIDGDAKPDIVVRKSWISSDTLNIFKNISIGDSIILAAAVRKPFPSYPSSFSNMAINDMNSDGKGDIITSGLIHIFRNIMDVPPIITGFSPAIVIASDTIKIKGYNLTGATAISLGTVNVSNFTVLSDTLIIAVPLLPVTGDITISNLYGSASISGLRVVGSPVIDSLVPKKGPVGSNVIVRGHNFSSNPNGNIVYFGDVKAVVNAVSDSSLSVIVPAGASYKPLTVTIPEVKLTGFSNRPFLVTFPGAGTNFTNSSFADRLDFTLDSTYDFVSGDFNQDGKSDLVMANLNAYSSLVHRYTIYKNNSLPGAVSFDQRKLVNIAHSPYNFSTCDINGDGKLDISEKDGTDLLLAQFLLNTTVDNNIRFDSEIVFHLSVIDGFNYPIDIDKDGRIDILKRVPAVNAGYVFRNLLNLERFTFGPAINLPNGGYGGAVSYSDLDGDGKLDLVFENITTPYTNSTIGLFRNTSSIGAPSFAARQIIPGNSSANIEIIDMDNDGKNDLVFVSAAGNVFSIYRNTSTPGVISFAPRMDSAFLNPGAIAVADMDGDGKPDIVISSNNTKSVYVVKNNSVPGQMIFAPKVAYDIQDIARNTLHLLDIDNDGKLDIITGNNSLPCCNYEESSFSVLRNRVGEPQLVQLCPGNSTTISSNIGGASFQWQLDTGTGYGDISDDLVYSGTNTGNLLINNIPSSWTGRKYRCMVDGNYSYEFAIKFKNTWTGAVSNAWENPLNWSCGMVPDLYTDVVINSGTVTINNDTTIWSLTTGLNVNLTIAAGINLSILH